MEYLGVIDGPGCGVAARLALLKQRLLLKRLNETPESETHALIIRQADEAALLAWISSYPLLVFPCLFEERAAASTQQARIQSLSYWNGLEGQPPTRVAPTGRAVRANPCQRPLPRGPAGVAAVRPSCASHGRVEPGIVNNI
jgi:hypothetical protein